MIFINLLYLLRKKGVGGKGDLDLVHTPIMAHPLLYSKNYAEKDTKKNEKESNKKCFFLDKCDSSCYNKDITIKKGKKLDKTQSLGRADPPKISLESDFAPRPREKKHRFKAWD